MADCDCVLQGDTPAGVDRCGERVHDGRLFVCTKPAGHDGQHSACSGAQHPAYTWEGA